jgi:two-component system NtrC family response regulator
LQEHTIQRLGAKETLTVDARILAATNVDLQQAINQGRFREDLYYRLCVVTIAMPALRERGSDVTLLARTFLGKFAEEQKKLLKGFTPQAIEAVRAHSWPGNVRELENRIKRAVVMAEGKYVSPANLELKDSSSAEEEAATLRASRDSREKDIVRLAMEKAEGNVSRAAVDLGISRPTLYQLLARYGLKKMKSESQKEDA